MTSVPTARNMPATKHMKTNNKDSIIREWMRKYQFAHSPYWGAQLADALGVDPDFINGQDDGEELQKTNFD